MAVINVRCEWEPVHGFPGAELDRRSLEQRVAAQSLQPVRWPSQWPPSTRRAMLAATYAKRIGRAVAFSLAAFRQAFAGGRDLGEDETILIAAAACEMHPAAVLKGIESRAVTDALMSANARAAAAGVRTLPAIELDGKLFDTPEQVG